MRFRLNFDDNVSAALIEKIKRRAAGGSLNKALQIMVIEWSAQEDVRKWSESGQKAAKIQDEVTDIELLKEVGDEKFLRHLSDSREEDPELEAALTSLNEDW